MIYDLCLVSRVFSHLPETNELQERFNGGELEDQKSALVAFRRLKEGEYTLADQRIWARNAHVVGVHYENQAKFGQAFKFYNSALEILLKGSENRLSLDDHANIMVTAEQALRVGGKKGKFSQETENTIRAFWQEKDVLTFPKVATLVKKNSKRRSFVDDEISSKRHGSESTLSSIAGSDQDISLSDQLMQHNQQFQHYLSSGYDGEKTSQVVEEIADLNMDLADKEMADEIKLQHLVQAVIHYLYRRSNQANYNLLVDLSLLNAYQKMHKLGVQEAKEQIEILLSQIPVEHQSNAEVQAYMSPPKENFSIREKVTSDAVGFLQEILDDQEVNVYFQPDLKRPEANTGTLMIEGNARAGTIATIKELVSRYYKA